MKKIVFLCSIILLSSCGTTQPSNINTNVNNDLPLFMNLNENASSSNIVMNTNENSLISNENVNNIQSINANINNNFNTNSSNGNINSTIQSSSESSINTNLVIPHEIAFSCKPLSIYESQPFYEKLMSQFESLNRYSTNDMAMMMKKATADSEKQSIFKQVQTTKEHRDNISSSCMANDESLFVFISEGDNNGYGFKIIRYQPQRNIMEIASREDEQHGTILPILPKQLGKRNGPNLIMSVSTKKGTKSEWFDLFYNYVTNSAKVGEYCKKDGTAKTECGNYNY